MSNHANRQPHFDNPPVTEVALSVTFVPLQNWQPPHAGLYWAQVADEYPRTEVHPPVASTKEKFGDEFWLSKQNVQVVFGPGMEVNERSWFLSEDDSRLVQIQRDRFIVNWRKRANAPQYPRYHEGLRPRFEREWRNFREFVRDKSLGEVIVEQCDITYVNDIEQGHIWNTFADFGKIFAPWVGTPADGFLPALQTLRCQGAFDMPDRLGRLHFHTQHLRRNTDKKEVLQLQLVARREPGSSDDADILRCIDTGHDWIVNGFIELTTPEAQQAWGRRD